MHIHAATCESYHWSAERQIQPHWSVCKYITCSILHGNVKLMMAAGRNISYRKGKSLTVVEHHAHISTIWQQTAADTPLAPATARLFTSLSKVVRRMNGLHNLRPATREPHGERFLHLRTSFLGVNFGEDTGKQSPNFTSPS